MKQSRKTIALLAAVLVLVILLLFANKNLTRQSPQTAGETVSPSPSAVTPTVTASLHDLRITATYIALLPKFPTIPPPPATTIAPTTIVSPTATSDLQPPQCTFPLAGTTAEESKPENYTFSEPQVVMTDEFQPSIVEWLPDNQNVLIMPFKFIDFGINGAQQIIELFNPETQETHIYAIRRDILGALPAWNSALNAIVYPDLNVVVGSTDSIQLRISYGNPDDTQLLADNLPQRPMVVKPDGSQIAYFLDNQLIRLDGALNPLVPVPADRKRWDYLHENGKIIQTYQMAWRPNSAQMFLYNQAGDGLAYAYILDTNNGRLCNLNFDGWVRGTTARWSPNGRYLAIVRAQGRIPIQSSDVAVLDTATGQYHVFKTADLGIKEGFAQDIAWAPDNRHLLFTVETDYSQTTHIYNGLLYLGDFISGQIEQVLPSFQFNIVGDARPNLAWSPDGSKLLMNGPAQEGSDQVWLIYVQEDGK
jgi:hypothetical protein